MLNERLRECGVVGAGGAGFPTYVKAQSQVEFLIANGAECEPLIHKDAELMKHFPGRFLAGHGVHDGRHPGADREIRHQDQERGGARGAAAESALRSGSSSSTLGDFYPSGDEYELVYTATGRLIPPAGIPLKVGCVVNNVETLYNVHLAGAGLAGDAKISFGVRRGEGSRNRSGRRWALRFAT